jgi:tetratricopeptide (TPR) repeat protein
MIVAVNSAGDRPAWQPEFRERYDGFWADGEAKGVNFSPLVAIELARRMVTTSQDMDERGAGLLLLGNALGGLGERETGTARLEEAAAAYRAALEQFTRDRVPLDWARTQSGLGTALGRLGERESGTARLERAVAAYRAALEEWTRDRVPLDWARTQMNLGNALWRLGERESGTARLEQAVAAYRAALEERTRDRVPLEWARTQMNLGNALLRLGERESGTARLEQAVAAWDACLTVTVTVWPAERVQQVRARRDSAQSEIERRSKG